MRILALLLLLCTLVGCSLVPDEYLSVQPHVVTGVPVVQTNAKEVRDYTDLKKAILGFVQNCQSEGKIRSVSYDGDMEADLPRAVYEITKLNPLGAYAVDYMTHDCTYIINHYEVTIFTTFRRTAREIAQVEFISTQSALRARLEQAAENYEPTVTVRISTHRELDIPAIIQEHCAAHPDTIMETPTVSISAYPDIGSVQIKEIHLNYTTPAKTLRQMETAVQENLDAAAEYIRYRNGDREKLELLFTYLLERFPYKGDTSATPVHDALVGGIADPTGMAQAWKLICDRAGMTCHVVQGLQNGEPYVWNIVNVDGYYRHLNLPQCVLEYGALVMRSDDEMGDYYWNTGIYPVCEPYPEEPYPEPQPEAQEPSNPGDLPAEPDPTPEETPPSSQEP